MEVFGNTIKTRIQTVEQYDRSVEELFGKTVCVFLLQLDESTDMSDIAQLAMVIKAMLLISFFKENTENIHRTNEDKESIKNSIIMIRKITCLCRSILPLFYYGGVLVIVG